MWVRLDDDFYDHPKIVGLSPPAGWLWVRMLAYCNRHETDGAVPRSLAPRKLAEELVDAGLWEPRIGGWQVHDYLDYQPANAALAAKRAETQARMSRIRALKKPTKLHSS